MHVFRRTAVIFAALAIVGVLVMLWLVLSTAERLRPESFRLKATLTKWLSLDLEMRSRSVPSAQHDEHVVDDETRREIDGRGDEQ
jgi:hypothetical protein